MRGLRTAAFVAAFLVFAGCRSSTTTAPGASAAPSSSAASEAPAQSEAPTANESTDPAAVVGSQPGTLSVTVGTHGAGFAGVICQDLGNGQLSVRSGDLNEGEAFAQQTEAAAVRVQQARQQLTATRRRAHSSRS